MDLRQLRYFVTVAEELNFSRAALRLHMSQPPLSHQIKALEDELGVVLLERNRRVVKLTEAGRAFLSDSRAVLDQMHAAYSRAKLLASGEAGLLRIGAATLAIDRVMPGFLARFSRVHLLKHLVVTDMGSDDQIRALAQDRLDLGFVHSRVVAKSMSRRMVHTEGFAIVLPQDHPLTKRKDLRLLDLADEPMVTFSREHRSALFDSLIAACINAGFSPRLVHVARHPQSLLQMVRQGLGVSVIPLSYASSAQPGVHTQALPLAEGSLQVDAIWREDNPSALLRHVIGHVLVPSDVLEPREALSSSASCTGQDAA